MKRKILAILLCLTCALGCAFGFTACGGGDNTGDGGDKTEQSTPTEKPDGNDGDKTDGDKTTDDKKPDGSDKDDKTDDKTEQGGDKTDDDKTEDDKKPDDSDDDGDDKTKPENPDEVEPNAYAEIAKTCKELAVKAGKTNVEILTICRDTDGYLAFSIKHNNGYARYTTEIEIGTTLESAKVVNITALSNSEIYGLSGFDKGVYYTDGTDDDKQLVESMIAKLLDDSYTVMCGTISTTRDNAVDAKLGANASFTVYALLEKDGSVFEYRETLSVSKDYNSGNVYQTVLGSTEANKADRYRSESKELTDLGEVAANYIAEEKRVAAATE